MIIKHLIVGPLLTNCYLVSSKGELAIIDPGGDAEKILEEIEKSNTKLKYIINTHFHPDHTSENLRIKNGTKAEILIHKNEKNFINFEADIFFKEGDEIKIGDRVLKVVHTPGHTKGSIGLLGENVLFTGDTIFEDGYGRTDLPGGSMEDLKQSIEKLSKLFKPRMIIYPGHGDIFKIK